MPCADEIFPHAISSPALA